MLKELIIKMQYQKYPGAVDSFMTRHCLKYDFSHTKN